MFSRKTRWILLMLCIILGIAVVWTALSCEQNDYNKWIDQSNKKEFYGKYSVHSDYTLIIPVFVTRYGLEAPLSEREPTSSVSGFPKTINEYKDSPDKWPQIVAVAPAGTMLRVTGIQTFRTTENFKICILADIDSLGMKGVSITGLSEPDRANSVLWQPIPAVLKKVATTNAAPIVSDCSRIN